jgi:hypothetical protein
MDHPIRVKLKEIEAIIFPEATIFTQHSCEASQANIGSPLSHHAQELWRILT